MDSNHRPSGYEPDELPLLHAATSSERRCIDLVSQGVLSPVPSALRRCTTRFGMVRGGSSALQTHLCSASWFLPRASSFVAVYRRFSVSRVVGMAHDPQALPDQASPRSSVGVGSNVHTPATAPLSYRVFFPGPYQPKAVRRLVLQWASHLDAFSGSPSRP